MSIVPHCPRVLYGVGFNTNVSTFVHCANAFRVHLEHSESSLKIESSWTQLFVCTMVQMMTFSESLLYSELPETNSM